MYHQNTLLRPITAPTRQNDAQFPHVCPHASAGATREECRRFTREHSKNVHGCCGTLRFKRCDSPERVCVRCVLVNPAVPRRVAHEKTDLCEMHIARAQKAQPRRRRAAEHDDVSFGNLVSRRELYDASSSTEPAIIAEKSMFFAANERAVAAATPTSNGVEVQRVSKKRKLNEIAQEPPEWEIAVTDYLRVPPRERTVALMRSTAAVVIEMADVEIACRAIGERFGYFGNSAQTWASGLKTLRVLTVEIWELPAIAHAPLNVLKLLKLAQAIRAIVCTHERLAAARNWLTENA